MAVRRPRRARPRRGRAASEARGYRRKPSHAPPASGAASGRRSRSRAIAAAAAQAMEGKAPPGPLQAGTSRSGRPRLEPRPSSTMVGADNFAAQSISGCILSGPKVALVKRLMS